MSKGTSIKDAIKLWEERTGENATTATDIGLQFQYPPIEKMDATLLTFVNCVKLSLSTNSIEKIINLSALSNLKILSLSRNNLKSLSGIESLSENLEQLWVSYNQIDRIKGIEVMKRLEVFYIGNNQIKDFTEINKLAGLTHLKDLLLCNNPCVESMDVDNYRKDVSRRLQGLKVLDGEPVVRDV